MRDPIDIDLALHENRCEQAEARRAAEHNADINRDDELTFEEQKRAAAAAYSQQVVGKFALWALRGVK